MNGHSILPPSSSARRVQCSASTRAEATYPQGEDSPEAAAGTAAHWGAAEMLSGRLVDPGVITPNGVFLTQEMCEAADLMYDDVARELAPYGLLPQHGRVEQPVAIRSVHEQAWGTPDYRVYVPAARRLFLYDFKYGFRPVEAFENWQLIEYISGAIDEIPGINGLLDQQIRVTAKIVQPRAHHKQGPVRAWNFTAWDIRAHINLASAAAHEALGPSPTFRVGAECRDCRARHACPTLQRAALDACDVAGKQQPFDLPPAALALEYRALKRHEALLSARITGLEEQALSMGRAGKPLPGLRIEHGAGREVWTVTDAQIIQIGQTLGVNVAKPPEAMTPKQAIKAGLPEAVLPGLVNTPRGAARLVEDDGSLARRIFA